MNTFTAWAIETNDPEHRKYSLIGRYWWFENKMPIIPPQLEGCQIAMFCTRKMARENLKYVKRAYPEAQVIKVRVNIFPVGNQ